MMFFYRALTFAASPFIPLWLRLRERRGKEDAARISERFGYASIARPAGKLIWVHAASVGEANSALGLIAGLRARYPHATLLLTTGTVTSASLMRKRLPAGVLHQFVPIDTPQATKRFMAHWQPNVGLLVESELWPNLLFEAHAEGCKLALINARISEKSFRMWNKFPFFIRTMLDWIFAIYAQSEADAERFRKLGATQVEHLGNLKFDGEPLAADAEELTKLAAAIGNRPHWLAASIHPGEDAMIAEVHRTLIATFPNLLTIVVPRHASRGAAMREVFPHAAQRSKHEPVTADTRVYIADTMGELGLFYRLCNVVFIGGSLIPHGGQNPLEPARLGCAILFGPHMFNFADIAEGLLQAEAAAQIADAASLVGAAKQQLLDAAKRAGMAARASAWVIGKAGVNERLIERLSPMLAEALA